MGVTTDISAGLLIAQPRHALLHELLFFHLRRWRDSQVRRLCFLPIDSLVQNVLDPVDFVKLAADEVDQLEHVEEDLFEHRTSFDRVLLLLGL